MWNETNNHKVQKRNQNSEIFLVLSFLCVQYIYLYMYIHTYIMPVYIKNWKNKTSFQYKKVLPLNCINTFFEKKKNYTNILVRTISNNILFSGFNFYKSAMTVQTNVLCTFMPRRQCKCICWSLYTHIWWKNTFISFDFKKFHIKDIHKNRKIHNVKLNLKDA